MFKKIMKKIAIAITAAAITFTAVTPAITVNAATVSYGVKKMSTVGYVNCAEGLNIRRKPTQNSVRLGGLQFGQQVQVTGRVYINGEPSGWMRIQYQGQPAFVRNALSASPVGRVVPTKTAAYSNKKIYTVNVAKGYLALRSEKAFNDNNEIGRLGNGARVKVIKRGGKYWTVMDLRTGKIGYVNSDFLR